MKNVHAYKTIGEVQKILELKPHILRSWEESFVQVKPIKRKGGRRLYSEDIINVLRTIKKLIYDEEYTIKGVKNYLSKNKMKNIQKDGSIRISEELNIKLKQIKKYLIKAKSVLNSES